MTRVVLVARGRLVGWDGDRDSWEHALRAFVGYAFTLAAVRAAARRV